jgi:type III restriction enzyme
MAGLSELRRQWAAKHASHDRQYEAVKRRASSHESQLKQISIAEDRLKVVRGLIAANNEKFKGFGQPENAYQQAKRNWTQVYKDRGELLQRKCEELTALSGSRIRASTRRGAGTRLAQDRLAGLLSGSNIRGKKIEELFARIGKANYPAAEWERALTEVEDLVRWGTSDATAGKMPNTPLLTAAGFSDKELDRIGRKLTMDDWLDLSLIELTDIPRFEYQQREKTYIEFHEASAGQQATALLRVLLNQDGPPLIIDQPEDDLDNQVVLEVVEELWKAKMKRQIIFSSHNANLVVNGDADLVVICNYRTLTDQSGGEIKEQGAIDIELIRREITTIMEGGKEAFRMRKEKYGF